MEKEENLEEKKIIEVCSVCKKELNDDFVVPFKLIDEEVNYCEHKMHKECADKSLCCNEC